MRRTRKSETAAHCQGGGSVVSVQVCKDTQGSNSIRRDPGCNE